MERPHQRPQQFVEIAPVQLDRSAHAEQVNPTGRDEHRQPDDFGSAFLPEHCQQDRDKHHIRAGNKAGIPGRGRSQSGLLKSAGREKHQSGTQHPGQAGFVSRQFEADDRQHDDRAENPAGGIIDERTHLGSAGTLGNKSKSPQDGCDKQGDVRLQSHAESVP